MSRRDKRRADTLLFSPLPLSGASSMQMPIASISANHPQSPEPRRSKRRKIDLKPDISATASTSTSDIVSTGSRTHQLLSKKRTRKARLAAETKINVLKTQDDETEQSEPSERLRSMLSAPLTPDSEVHEMENMSAVNDVIQAEDLVFMDKIAALEEQLREKDKQIEAQRTVFDTLQQQVQCQICLDTFVQPFTLVPCGHTACMGCLQQWFNTPNGANEEIYGAMPVIRRKKTCPHCRTPVVQRPVAAHLLKALTNEVQTGWAALTARTPPVEGAIVQGDPWKDIFPSERNGANRGGDGAIIDHEDGGVRRCAHCLTEIYHGVCEGCGEEYDVEDYLSDESLEFGPYPAQRLRPLLYRDNFIVDGDAPPQRWREVYDDEEDGELDEYEEDFINDGDIDHMEGEDDGYHSEEPRRGPVRFEMPLPTHNRDRYVGAIVVEDSEDDDEDEDEEEIIPHPALNPRRRVAAIVVSDDDEESVQEILSEDEDTPPARMAVRGQYIRPLREENSEEEEEDEDPMPPHRFVQPARAVYPGPQYYHMQAAIDRRLRQGYSPVEETSPDEEEWFQSRYRVHYEDQEVETDPHAETETVSDLEDQGEAYYSDEY